MEDNMSKSGFNLLVVGYENTGKSRMGSMIKDCLIINCDHKAYVFDAVHSNYAKWNGIDDFKSFVNNKIVAYKEKFGHLPKNVAIDTVTHMYNSMIKHNSDKNTNGFKAMEENNQNTIDIADYFRLLNSKGINVIIFAHTKIDQKTDQFTVPAQGSFRDSGSWQSFVSEGIFISRDRENHLVVLKDASNRCVRTNLKEIIESDEAIISVPFNDFDINKHIDKIASSIVNTAKEL